MNRILLPVLAMLVLNGCATMAATLGCEWEGSAGCPDEVLDVAMRLDGNIIGAVLGAADGPQRLLERVSVEGVVTSSGSPLEKARVDLVAGSELWTVRTDRSGRYQIHGVVEQGHCAGLHFTIRHPDRNRTDRLPVDCTEQRLDHDFSSPPS